MEKCLVTKLKGSVADSDLVTLGELRFSFAKGSGNSMILQSGSSTKVGIIGDGYFTDSSYTENKGTTATIDTNRTTLYLSSNVEKVAIYGKYDLTYISCSGVSSLELNDLKYTKNLGTLVTANLKGNLSDLENLTELTEISVSKAEVTGNIESLKKLTKMLGMRISSPNTVITGDISSLSSMSNLTSLILEYMKLEGDLATLPPNIRCIVCDYPQGSTFTWGTRPSTSSIFGISGGPKVTNVDDMLINMAQCQAPSGAASWQKVINVVGTRTSASDEATSVLTEKGYTVWIHN